MHEDGHGAAVTTLPPRPTSARTARRFVADALQRWALEDLADTAELLTSELVSNVVLHARSHLRLRVRRSGGDGSVRIEVIDSSPSLPQRHDRAADATSGRGLVLVDALAADWGVDPTPRGKIVWFEVTP